ncbi:MAG TPA: hypothetical protein VG265_15740 [Gaiellaceae bacterium]|jgi:hypothetical protein|nr:hypothetical protein [Gaiellaceae bacterium]
MPVERQAERVAMPLRPTDRRFLLVFAIVAALAIAAGGVWAATRSGAKDGERCFSATYPSSMGGASIHHCGPAAVHYCAVDANLPQVADACRAAGFAVETKP